jgi:hypothetical protein
MAITNGGQILDADNNPITSQTNGTQQAMDVGVNVAGVQVDPRVIRPLTPGSDSLNVQDITGTVSLPTGAATSAKQDTGNTSLSSIDGKIVTVDTGNVTVVSSALPSGAATSAKQDTGNTSLASIDGKLNSLGQKAMTASTPVVIASDQSAINVVTTIPKGGLTDASGTVGTSSASLLAANPSRKYLLIQNVGTGNLWINFGTTATASQPSIKLTANSSFTMEANYISTDQIFGISDKAGNAYVIKHA